MTQFFVLGDGRTVEASELVGDRTFVQATWADRSKHVLGRVLAYCDSPQFLIETPSGERVWWRADMTHPAAVDEISDALQVVMDERKAAK